MQQSPHTKRAWYKFTLWLSPQQGNIHMSDSKGHLSQVNHLSCYTTESTSGKPANPPTRQKKKERKRKEKGGGFS